MEQIFNNLNLEFMLYFPNTKNISHHLRTESQVNLSSNNTSESGIKLFH